MKQIKVSIPDNLLAELEKAAAKERRSLSEAVRERLMGTAGRVDLGRSDIAALVDKIAEMAVLAEAVTAKRWDKDPSTTQLLALSVAKLLQRHGAREVAEIPTSETYQREGLVQSTDPKVIATALEFLVHFRVRLGDRPDLEDLRASAEAKIRERGKE
jgi:hypothetical protein